MLKLIKLSSFQEKVKRSLNINKSHLEGAETVSKLEVEVRKLFEVWTLEKVVINILG